MEQFDPCSAGMLHFFPTEVQGISFVGYTGVRVANLACGTYKTYALYLRTVSTIPFALIFCKDMVLCRVVQGVLNHP